MLFDLLTELRERELRRPGSQRIARQKLRGEGAQAVQVRARARRLAREDLRGDVGEHIGPGFEVLREGAGGELGADARVGEVRRRSEALRSARAGWLPAAVRDALQRVLDDAEIHAAADEVVTIAVGVWASAVVVAAGFVTPMVPGVLIAGVMGIPWVIVVLRQRADRRFVAALPVLLDDVIAQLHSGSTVVGALVELRHRPSPLRGDLTRLDARLRLGADLRGALAQWAEERRSSELTVVTGGLALAATAGGPSVVALEGLARSVRDLLSAQADAAALSAQARMSAVVVGAAPIAYLVFSSLIDGNAARALLGSASGRVCLVAGLLLEALGVVWMRRIVRSQP